MIRMPLKNRIYSVFSVIFLILAFLALPLSVSEAQQPTFRGQHVEVSLVAKEEGITPSSPVSLGIRFLLEPGWHLYWKNPGDSGKAPRFDWSLDEKSVPADFDWPTPKRIPVGPLVNFGYEGEVILFATLPTDPSIAQKEHIVMRVLVEWLVCREECIPGDTTLERTFAVVPFPKSIGGSEGKLFEENRNRLPKPLEGFSGSAKREGDSISISLELSKEFKEVPSGLEFFPEQRSLTTYGETARGELNGGKLVVSLPLDHTSTHTYPSISGVLVADQPLLATGEKELLVQIMGPDKITLAAPLTSQESKTPFVTVLLFAFLGGLILNVMPCVLPVLALKVFSLIKAERKAALKDSLAYGAGILISFWLLASLLFLLRATGKQLGWGFQLQSPLFVTLLFLTCLVVALNLLGVFDFGAKLQKVANNACNAAPHNGFLNGVLAVVLATPCSAPFMASAVGVALFATPFEAFLLFTALGLGMAAPYALLALSPGLSKLFPKPGVWMELVKQFLAFPMLGTALWLLWILHFEVLNEGILYIQIAALVVALALWIYGRVQTSSLTKSIRSFWLATVLILLSSAGVLAFQGGGYEVSEKIASPGEHGGEDYYSGLTWESYSDERLKTLIMERTPVYVDFTAAWCITCQVNKKIVFSNSEVKRLFTMNKVVILRGDWTNQDPAITQALARYERSSVPCNILYLPGRDPVLFPTVLTPAIVLESLTIK